MRPPTPGRRFLRPPPALTAEGEFSRHADLPSLAGGAKSGHAAGHGPDATLQTRGQGRSTRGAPRGSFLRCCGKGQPSREPFKGSGLAVPRTSAAPIFRANGEPVYNEPIARYTRQAC
ncbi:hypothetical protein MRX96_011866 [Rhipicephalus microplus]